MSRQTHKQVKINEWVAVDPLSEKQAAILLPFDTLTPPGVGIFDAPTRCFTVNEEWAAIIEGMIGLLTEIRVWKGVYEENATPIIEVLKLLEGGKCMDCQDVIDCIDNNPNLTAVSSFLLSSMEKSTSDFTDSLNTAYDGTPQSIGADIPAGAPNATESTALCYSLEQFVSFYCATKRAQISRKSDLQVAFDDIKSASINLFNATVDYLAPGVIPDIGACFVDDNTALSALADTYAQSLVTCCLNDNLSGGAISEAAFNSAIASCASSLPGNAQKIACVMQSDNSLNSYLVFLHGYQTSLERQASGETLTCVCDETWCYEFDFTVSDHGFVAVPHPSTLQESTHSGLGWTGYYHAVGNPDCVAHITRTLPNSCHITACEVELSSIPECVPEGCSISIGGSTDPWLIPATIANPITTLVSNNAVNVPATDLTVYVYHSGSSPTTIKRVKISGTGLNPFGTDNC